MKSLHRIPLLLVTLSVFIVPFFLHAGEQSQNLPNLIGTWVGEYDVHFLKGQKRARMEFQVKEQDGPYFRGVQSWKDIGGSKPLTTKKGELITSDSEAFVGVIGFDGKTITVVEHDDHGKFHGELLGKDTMQVVYAEPGSNAVVFRTIVKRKLVE